LAVPSSSRGRRASVEEAPSSSHKPRSPELLVVVVEVFSGERPQRQQGSGGRRRRRAWCAETRYEVEAAAAAAARLCSGGDGGGSRKLKAICKRAVSPPSVSSGFHRATSQYGKLATGTLTTDYCSIITVPVKENFLRSYPR
jgi:hypothetical protein